jgi:hypothetical protein
MCLFTVQYVCIHTMCWGFVRIAKMIVWVPQISTWAHWFYSVEFRGDETIILKDPHEISAGADASQLQKCSHREPPTARSIGVVQGLTISVGKHPEYSLRDYRRPCLYTHHNSLQRSLGLNATSKVYFKGLCTTPLGPQRRRSLCYSPALPYDPPSLPCPSLPGP